ncbi:Lrp/AsnC family transcriptional regulator, partial [Chloroflexota bacterium]
TQLSEKLGISVASISRRVNRLIKDKQVEITAVPSVGAAGYNAIAVIALGITPGKIDYACSKLGENPAVQFVAITFGRFDVVIHVYFSSSEMLTNFVKNELSAIEGIIQVETFVVAELKKRTFGWLRERIH